MDLSNILKKLNQDISSEQDKLVTRLLGCLRRKAETSDSLEEFTENFLTEGYFQDILSIAKPKKALEKRTTGWNLFCMEKRGELRKKRGDIPLQNYSKCLGQMWGKLSSQEKDEYKVRAKKKKTQMVLTTKKEKKEKKEEEEQEEKKEEDDSPNTKVLVVLKMGDVEYFYGIRGKTFLGKVFRIHCDSKDLYLDDWYFLPDEDKTMGWMGNDVPALQYNQLWATSPNDDYDVSLPIKMCRREDVRESQLPCTQMDAIVDDVEDVVEERVETEDSFRPPPSVSDEDEIWENEVCYDSSYSENY